MTTTRLLVNVRGDGQAFAAALSAAFGAAALEIEPILRVPPTDWAPGRALGPTGGSTWLRVATPSDEEHPWDAAHELTAPGRGRAAAGVAGIEAVEPDVDQSWVWAPPEMPVAGAAAADRCVFQDQDAQGGKATGPGLAWNAETAFSEFREALATLGATLPQKLGQIAVAHLDTGYDPDHLTRPVNLDTARQRNFVRGDPPDDATDRTPPGMGAIRNRGHGTATLALLAGHALDGTSPGWPGFQPPVGGAPYVRVIPIRIADWVVRFSTSTMVQGFDHARQTGAHVLSMSMGGLTSRALADSGYLSEANVEHCAAAKIEPLIAMRRERHNARWQERFADEPAAPAAAASAMRRMAHRLKTRRGRKLYALRKQTPESVCGIMQSVMGFRQFLLRGVDGARGEWTRVTMSWNLRRMFALSQA